jgi:hypothetical protein
MGDSFFGHLELLELMGFFSGYPLVYAIILIVAGNKENRTSLKRRLVSLLPYAYALTGTLYIGFLLKNGYPDFSITEMFTSLQYPFLRIWGILSLLFWMPYFSRKPIFSLLHSFVFFFLLIRDFFIQLSGPSFDKHVIRNDMKVYTDSLLLTIACLAALLLIVTLFRLFRKGKIARS